MDFKVGDLVKLKSGGPLMTVENVGERAMVGGEAVFCVWFEKVGSKQVAQREHFSPAVLEAGSKQRASIGISTFRS